MVEMSLHHANLDAPCCPVMGRLQCLMECAVLTMYRRVKLLQSVIPCISHFIDTQLQLLETDCTASSLAQVHLVLKLLQVVTMDAQVIQVLPAQILQILQGHRKLCFGLS